MTPLAFLLTAASAGLHATWHMMAKKSGASIAFYAVLVTVGLALSSVVWLFTPLRYVSQPPAFFAWQCGVIASELAYSSGLKASYRALDMSTAYPMMRALPLLILAGVTSIFGIGKPLGATALAGMAMVFVGCLLTPLVRFSDFRPSRYMDRKFGYIILVALGTAGYTLCDSQSQIAMREAAAAAGTEISGALLSLTYYAFREPLLCAVLWIAVLCGRESRADAVALARRRSPMPLVAGTCAAATYLLVLAAMNFVSNVAYIQAFRQIGLVFGLLEGVLILKEKCTAPKVVGVLLILSGLAVSVL